MTAGAPKRRERAWLLTAGKLRVCLFVTNFQDRLLATMAMADRFGRTFVFAFALVATVLVLQGTCSCVLQTVTDVALRLYHTCHCTVTAGSFILKCIIFYKGPFYFVDI